MMKGRVLLLLLWVVLSPSMGHALDISDVWERLKQPQEIKDIIALSRISLAYELVHERWISFEAPIPATSIKILTNANLQAKDFDDPEEKWRYAFDYQIIEPRSQRVIKSGTYHHITKLTKFIPKQGGAQYTGAYYLDKRVVPADGRYMVLNLDGIGDRRKGLILKLRLANTDPGITGVVVRTYALEPTSTRRLEHAWRRTSRLQKEHLARGNVYAPDFLTEEETLNLTRQAWMPIGPQGIEGRDYTVRKMYVVREIEGTPVEPPVLEAGLYMDQDLRGTVPVPEKGARLRFLFSPAIDQERDKKTEIAINWFGKGIGKRKSWSVPWNGLEMPYENSFEGGLVEISVQNPCIVKVFSVDDGNLTEVTPEVTFMRTYATVNDHAVLYRVAHAGDAPTPLRADLRAIMSEKNAPPKRKVSYAFLDNDQRVVTEGTINFESILSLYDRPMPNDPPLLLSDPVPYYFRVPAETPFVRFSCDSQVLISAYTRPAGLPKKTEVPEDYFRSTEKDDQRQPHWFAIRPLGYQDLLKDQRSVLVQVQFRPPEDDPLLATGRFLWEAFRPSGDWLGQYLLTPIDESLPYQRDESLVSTFLKAPLNQDFNAKVRSGRGLNVIEPTMVFFRKIGADPFDVCVLINRKEYYRTQLIGNRGMVKLPPLPEGTHTFRVETESQTDLFINYMESDGKPYLLRFAGCLTEKGFEVEYVKRSQEDETLSIILFSPFPRKERSDIMVTIEGAPVGGHGPFKGFSIFQRRFSVRPSDEGPFPIINLPKATTDAGQRLFFPLHEDLPPGRYSVRVTLENGPGGYMVLSRVIPGRAERREIWREANVHAADKTR